VGRENCSRSKAAQVLQENKATKSQINIIRNTATLKITQLPDLESSIVKLLLRLRLFIQEESQFCMCMRLRYDKRSEGPKRAERETRKIIRRVFRVGG
jgi:hypothetical protein